MTKFAQSRSRQRPLRPGDQVSIVSRDEILASQDADGCPNGMLVMPQMSDMSGTMQTVAARADKSCDTINGSGGLRLHDTVHLEGARCDGKACGGCRADCLLFWNERWSAASFEQATERRENCVLNSQQRMSELH